MDGWIDGWIDGRTDGRTDGLAGWLDGWMDGRTDGWMDCNFTPFSTVFQSHWDDGRVIMKDCVQWDPFTFETISASGGAQSLKHQKRTWLNLRTL